jgi:ubiquinol-cytochrome c reductase cytochrome c1 subunit
MKSIVSFMKVCVAVLGMSLTVAHVSANEHLVLEKAPIVEGDQASLQRGARAFANYCQGCHSANYLRYSRLTEIGLTEDEIKANLMFNTDKVGDTMSVAMDRTDGKTWFGAAPPDLSVEARVRGADWLYTYLKGFYRDDSRPTGWNNTAFPNVGMPHVLYELQGIQEKVGEGHELKLVKAGKLSPAQYDVMSADIVNYLVWMAEPGKANRLRLGVYVLMFLAVAFAVTVALKKEFWKDIH